MFNQIWQQSSFKYVIVLICIIFVLSKKINKKYDYVREIYNVLPYSTMSSPPVNLEVSWSLKIFNKKLHI